MTASLMRERVVDRLGRLHPKVIDLGLDRVRRLLDRLGRPEERLPPVIHIAGTNGKGSVAAMARACLEAGGKRVHLYTSPHLVRFNERIVVAGREIDDARLAALMDEAETANAGAPITFFEITTALALLAFAREPADVAILEVGLGGRLDATNVVRPVVAAITPIGMDHQAWLGDSIAAIAAEKAAILKGGAAAVIAPQEAAARAVIEGTAARAGAAIVPWSAHPRGDGFVFRSPRRRVRLPRPALAGRHQIDNAGVALACLDALGAPVLPDAALAAGLAAVHWPARLQRLPGARDVWLDGGHNLSAGEALAAAASEWTDRPLHLIVGMMRAKDPSGFLAPLARRAAALTAVPVPYQENGLPPADIAAAARELGLAADMAESVPAALVGIHAGARVLICGSLYLAGSVLAGLGADARRQAG